MNQNIHSFIKNKKSSEQNTIVENKNLIDYKESANDKNFLVKNNCTKHPKYNEVDVCMKRNKLYWMKSTKTYPNILWLTINFMFLTIFGILILVCLEWIFEFIGFFKNSNQNKIGMLILLFLVSSIFLYLYYQLANHFTFAKINSSEITLFQLLKLKILKLKFSEIYGYSKSEISYGRVPLNYCSKSLIIYSIKNNPFEIIKLFNVNFENFETALKKTEITYLGKEQYEFEKMYKRKFKYVK